MRRLNKVRMLIKLIEFQMEMILENLKIIKIMKRKMKLNRLDKRYNKMSLFRRKESKKMICSILMFMRKT